MLDNASRAVAAPPLACQLAAVEFYTVELAPLEGGMIGVSLLATTIDEEDLQLLHQELGASRVSTIDDALAFVKASVRLS